MSSKWGDSLFMKELEGWYLRLCRPKGRMGVLSHLSCALGTWRHINGCVCDCVCVPRAKQNRWQPAVAHGLCLLTPDL